MSKPKLLISLVLLLGSALLLFVRLGHYALWDDEALTALFAKSVWRTGDTSAQVDHNVVGYRNGLLLRSMRDRFEPPAMMYVAAPFVGVLGDNALAARLPFALMGFASVALIVCWLYQDGANLLTWLLMAMGILGNVSLFLFFRQARYYGLVVMLSLFITYLYLHWRGRRREVVLIALLLSTLMLSHYLDYLALCSCLALDYALWGRKRQKLAIGDWAIIVLPQAMLALWLLLVWGAGGPTMGEPAGHPLTTLAEKLQLIWWNLRDLNANEFGVGLVLLAAPLLYLWRRDLWLIRACLCLIVYVIVVAATMPRAQVAWFQGTVRSLVPLILLCIAIEVRVLLAIAAKSLPAAILIATAAFFTNALHLSFITSVAPRCTLLSYIAELVQPQHDPYTAASNWIAQNVREEQSIWVVPDYMTYPLMFHQPKAIYGWQFTWRPDPDIQALPPIQITGRLPPDYIIVFGLARRLQGEIDKLAQKGAQYERATSLNVFWHDVYRPELTWRQFRDVRNFNPDTDGIYIFNRIDR